MYNLSALNEGKEEASDKAIYVATSFTPIPSEKKLKRNVSIDLKGKTFSKAL